MIDKALCCGCMACFNICPVRAIDIYEDEEGFFYPKIDNNKCINCNLCNKVCDFKLEHENTLENKSNVYSAEYKDDIVRKASTSGGMFTALYELIIKNNGVVYGAVLTKNLDVVHKRCTTKNECEYCRGSKYVQSDINKEYAHVEEDLKDNKIVLFTGTACQIEGIKKYLEIKKIDTTNLITCDFICHGVPSKKIFKEHIKNLELVYNKKVKCYKFRTKTKGWKGHNEEAIFEDNSILNEGKHINIYKELYGSLNIIRPSCYKCPYAKEQHKSDITIGDFWGIEKIEKTDNLGTSFLMLNTAKGKKLFNKIKENIKYSERKISECNNPQLHKSVELPVSRIAFWNLYKERGFIAIAKKYTTFGKINLLKRKTYRLLDKIGVIRLIKRNNK